MTFYRKAFAPLFYTRCNQSYCSFHFIANSGIIVCHCAKASFVIPDQQL